MDRDAEICALTPGKREGRTPPVEVSGDSVRGQGRRGGAVSARDDFGRFRAAERGVSSGGGDEGSPFPRDAGG